MFDAALLHAVLTALGPQLQPHLSGAAQAALASLTAVDGRLVPALPRMLWAVWHDGQHRAATMHVAFAVLCHGPVDVTVGSPERLVYEGEVSIGKGLERLPRISSVLGGNGSGIHRSGGRVCGPDS